MASSAAQAIAVVRSAQEQLPPPPPFQKPMKTVNSIYSPHRHGGLPHLDTLSDTPLDELRQMCNKTFDKRAATQLHQRNDLKDVTSAILSNVVE